MLTCDGCKDVVLGYNYNATLRGVKMCWIQMKSGRLFHASGALPSICVLFNSMFVNMHMHV